MKYSLEIPMESESLPYFSLIFSILSVHPDTKKGTIMIDKTRLPASIDSPVDIEKIFSIFFNITVIPKNPYIIEGIPDKIFISQISIFFVNPLE